MICARLKKNTFVIATMALLVAISILGASLSSIIKANGEKYYRESYLAETILSSSAEWNYYEGINLYENLQADDGLKVSCICSAGYPAQLNGVSVGSPKVLIYDANGIPTGGVLQEEIEHALQISVDLEEN